MAKVQETKGTKLPPALQAKPAAGQVQLTLDNAPLITAKFLEQILQELRKMNAFLEKSSG